MKVLIKFFIDYENLQYFITIKKQSKRLFGWEKFLSGLHFVIFKILKEKNLKINFAIVIKTIFYSFIIILCNKSRYQPFLMGKICDKFNKQDR